MLGSEFASLNRILASGAQPPKTHAGGRDGDIRNPQVERDFLRIAFLPEAMNVTTVGRPDIGDRLGAKRVFFYYVPESPRAGLYARPH